MRIRGTVALVTGASSGIGRCVAERLLAAGAEVIAHGRDEAALASLGCRYVVADLSLPGEAERLAKQAGPVDVLVANAGTGYAGPFVDMPDDAAENLLTTNLTAPIRLTRALLPTLLDRGTGSLVYVTSIAGRTGVAGEAVYAATKAGLDAFAESLRYELRHTRIRVGVVVPGVVETPFFARRGQPYTRTRPRPIPADGVARAVLALVESGAAEAYRPRWLRVPVLLRGVAPGVFRRLAGRFGGS